jgi:hypothetical protein
MMIASILIICAVAVYVALRSTGIRRMSAHQLSADGTPDSKLGLVDELKLLTGASRDPTFRDAMKAGDLDAAVTRLQTLSGRQDDFRQILLQAMVQLRTRLGPSALKFVGEDAEIRAMIGAGKKIDAIKLYRERTGTSLDEAKTAIENWA